MESQDKTTNKDFFSVKDVAVHSEIPLRDRVRILLLRKGMSQNQLADNIGISIGTMSKIVNEDWLPTSQIKIRMAQILDCDSLVLFGGSGYWEEYSQKISYEKKEEKNE